MGVRGLTTYVNYNQNLFLKYHILHDSKLVVDGHSLCAQLYRKLNSFPAFGGDYDKYAAYVKKFFKNLRKCKIECYVLFDGSYETRKLKTAYGRLRSKIKGASRLDPVTQTSLSIFPLFLREVMKEVLTEMQIPYTVCELEADDEIAAVARQLQCPVLSYDSDFFIYNVMYIPFNTLEMKPACFEDDGSTFYGLECKLYKVEYLVQSFGGLKEVLLPLFATLIGNDYIQKKVFKNFFSQMKLGKGRNKNNDLQRSIHGLFQWLQNETLESAVEKIIGRIKKNKKQRVLYLMKKNMRAYDHRHCRSLQYFNIVTVSDTEEKDLNIPDVVEHVETESSPENDSTASEDESSSSENEEQEESEDEEKEESEDDNIVATIPEDPVSRLPRWLTDRIRTNVVPKPYICLYTLHLYFMFPQAEDYNDEDAFLCALSILRYAFDILTDFCEENFLYISREKASEYKRVWIGTDYALPRPVETNYGDMELNELNVYFTHFVKVKLPGLDLAELDPLPSNFRLAFLSILFWVANCQVPTGYLHSLFLSYIMLEVVDEKTGTFRGHHFFNTKHSKKLEELKTKPKESIDKNESLLNKNKVEYEDCLLAASVLLQHFEISNDIKKKPKSYDIRKVHKFAQFQCCLQQLNYISTLSGEYYEMTRYSKLYNGTFVYNIANKLQNQTDPCAFVVNWLKGADTVISFYKSICRVYEKCSKQLGLETLSSGISKRKRRGKKASKNNSFITENFESEVAI